MLTRLLQAKANNDCISIFFDRSAPNRAIVGLVRFADAQNVVLRSFTRYGRADGFLLKKTSNIIRIESNSDYEIKIMRLYAHRGREAKEPVLNSADWSLDGLLDHASAHGLIVGLGVEGDDEVRFGLLRNLEADTLQLALLDEYGKPNGLAVFLRSDIDHLELHSEDCRTLELLRSE